MIGRRTAASSLAPSLFGLAAVACSSGGGVGGDGDGPAPSPPPGGPGSPVSGHPTRFAIDRIQGVAPLAWICSNSENAEHVLRAQSRLPRNHTTGGRALPPWGGDS